MPLVRIVLATGVGETHAGEDVPIHAGCGVQEQRFVPRAFAGALGWKD